MNKKHYLSSQYVLFVLIIENIFFLFVLVVSIYAIFNGFYLPGLGLASIAVFFSWVTLKSYRIVFVTSDMLHVKPLFQAKEVYGLDKIKSVKSVKGRFAINLTSGKDIPLFDSHLAYFPVLIFEKHRRKRIERKLNLL